MLCRLCSSRTPVKHLMLVTAIAACVVAAALTVPSSAQAATTTVQGSVAPTESVTLGTFSLFPGDTIKAQVAATDSVGSLTIALVGSSQATLAVGSEARPLQWTAAAPDDVTLAVRTSATTDTAYLARIVTAQAVAPYVSASPSIAGYGGSTWITTQLFWARAGQPLSGQVVLQRSNDKKTWRNMVTVTTGLSGQATAYRYRPTGRTYVRALHKGVDGQSASGYSQTIVLNRKALLRRPSAPSKARRKKSFIVSGTVSPKQRAGSRPVRLECYRYEGSEWVWRKTVGARVTTKSSTTSSYRVGVTLPYAGRWRIRARVDDSSLNARTFSTYEYVSVNPTSISISSDRSTATYGHSVTLSGRLKDMDGRGLKGRKVYLERSSDGQSWSYSKTLKSGSNGALRVKVKPAEKRYYRFRYAGSSTQKASNSSKKLVKARSITLSGYGSSTRKVYLESGDALLMTMFEDYVLGLRVYDPDGKRIYSGAAIDFDYSIYQAVIHPKKSGTYKFVVDTDDYWVLVIF